MMTNEPAAKPNRRLNPEVSDVSKIPDHSAAQTRVADSMAVSGSESSDLRAPAANQSSIDTGFDKRLLIVAVAAILIVGACVWKLTQPVDVTATSREDQLRKPAPRFELPDQKTRLVKFERYLGRHRILLVFFDGDFPPDQDDRLVQLRKGYSGLSKNNTVVVAVSGGLPQTNRSGTAFPFPILTDLQQRDPGSHFNAHKLWGSYDAKAKKPLFKTFLIDRRGDVAWTDQGPKEITNSTTVINALINGQDPQL